MVLRIPALVRTILGDVNAVAAPTSIRGGSLYHAQLFIMLHLSRNRVLNTLSSHGKHIRHQLIPGTVWQELP
jgi:hypothetical protein